MRELDFIIPIHPKFERDEHKLMSIKLRPLATNKYYLLYLLKDNSLEAVEAHLRESGMSEDLIESEIYQLRFDLNTIEELFYTRTAAIDPHYRIEFNKASPDEQHIHTATEYIKQKDYVQADAHLKAAIKLDQKAILAYANLAVIALRKRYKKRALALYNKALEIDPHHVQLLTHKMFLLSSYLQATLSEFTEIVDKLLELQPGHPTAMMYKFLLLHHKKNMYDIQNCVKLYFKYNYLEAFAGESINDLLLRMTVTDSLEFLDEFASELKCKAALKALSNIKQKYQERTADFKPRPNERIMNLVELQFECLRDRKDKKNPD